jgi:hypothetical protein
MTAFTLEYKSKHWLILQCLKDFGDTPRRQITGSGEDVDANKAVRTLICCGMAQQLGHEILRLTARGSRALRECNAMKGDSGVYAGKREISSKMMSEDYQGQELRRTCLRPGAYDAFELPSLLGNTRHYRREIKA